MIERVRGTALYLLSQGMVLKHGDTLGISASELIRVEHADKGRYVSGPVLKLTYETNSARLSG